MPDDDPLSVNDAELLQLIHRETLKADGRLALEILGNRLSQLPSGPKKRNHERIGESALLVMSAEARRRGRPATNGRAGGERSGCQTLERPEFDIESPTVDGDSTFSEADRQGGTLEFLARAGALNGRQYPSVEGDFLGMAQNNASASLGAAVALPPHGQIPGFIAELRVTVELVIEEVWDNPANPLPGSASNLVWVEDGSANLAFHGAAFAFAEAGLTLVGAGGSRTRRSVPLVTGWANSDGNNVVNSAPGGRVRIQHSAIISPGLLVAGVFVDGFCQVVGETGGNINDSAYAELACRKGAAGYPVPSQLRLVPERTEVVFCERQLLAPTSARSTDAEAG